MTPEQFHEMVNTKSGLLGISETSSDVRDLLAREKEDIRAAEALAVFCYRVKQAIGAFAAALGGLDTLVFSGGVGENAVEIRARIVDGLGFLGVELDHERNGVHGEVITRDDSRVTVRVIHTDEESEIARSALAVLGT
jgi:acetate kinase